jgi:RHS repeat-associated protein
MGNGGADLGVSASPESQDKRRGGVQSTLGYAGMFYHARSGLYLTHYRAYDPRLGRWLSRDPIWESGGVNLYGYVGGDPVSYYDPYGLSKYDKLYGIPRQFWNWYHKKIKGPGDPDLTKEEARDLYKEWQDRGMPGPDSKGRHKGFVDPDLLEWLIPWPLTPSELGCSELDCNHNGIPDYEEESQCK